MARERSDHSAGRAGLDPAGVAAPLAAYVPAVRTGNLVYTSGQLPTVEGQLLAVGKVGGEVSVETAADCARIAALNGLAAIAAEVGDLDAVLRVVKVVSLSRVLPDSPVKPRWATVRASCWVSLRRCRHARPERGRAGLAAAGRSSRG